MSFDYRLDKYYDEPESALNEELVSQLNSSGRYKELTKIASGGMKTIYKAFDQKSQRYVAYATLNEDTAGAIRETFIKEARLTAKLSHPNIIPVYNIGLAENQRPYFTMELKTGDSLKDIIKNLRGNNNNYTEKYGLRELLGIFIKVCDAIDFAHSKKVIHLDIKPDNIQVGSYGEVIVCDWGLSKIYDKQTDTMDINQSLLNPENLNTSTLHGQVKGTPGFMAPEQIEGKTKTTKTDIFSLGCLLYSLLSCEAPFKGDTLDAILSKTVDGTYDILKDIPQSLLAVVEKAMKSDSEKRYSSVSLLKSDVENFLEGYATQAEEASSLKLLKLFILRNRSLSFITVIFLIVIVTGTAAFISNITKEKERAEENLRLFKDQKQETTKAQREYYAALINHENNHFHTNYTITPTQSHSKTISGLQELVKAYPDYSEAKSALGYHYFVGQEFSKSKELLQKAPGIYSYMLPHLDKYIPLKGGKNFLPPNQFQKLLNDVEPFKALHIKMLMIYHSKQSSVSSIEPIVISCLKRMNPEWDEKGFNYDEENKKLTISGANFKNIGIGDSSPIRALKFKALSLRNTEIASIRSLTFIPIRALDLSNTGISYFHLKTNMPKGLTRLIINSQQYNLKRLEELKLSELKFSDVKLSE